MFRIENFFAGEAISVAELSALKLDGEVYELGDRFVPVDTVESPQTKAEMVLARNEDFFCISGLSALWVSGLIREPRRHELALLSTKRPTDVLLVQRDVRDLGDLVGKTTCFAGRHCLKALDALIEVLRNPKVATAEVKDVLEHVSAHNQRLIVAARLKLKESVRVPFTNLALVRLALADPVNVVDGVDAPYRVEHAL